MGVGYVHKEGSKDVIDVCESWMEEIRQDGEMGASGNTKYTKNGNNSARTKNNKLERSACVSGAVVVVVCVPCVCVCAENTREEKTKTSVQGEMDGAYF